MDGPGNPSWLLRAAVMAVVQLVRERIPTLVCCGAGMSRTPAIVGAAIALVRGCALGDGLALVAQVGAADVSPALWAEVEAAIRERDVPSGSWTDA